MKFDVPSFGGEPIGKEPDAHFFARIAEMPPSEAEEELRAAKAWAVYQSVECDRVGKGSEGNSYRALITKINEEIRRLGRREQNYRFQTVVTNLFGPEGWQQVRVELARLQSEARG